MHRTHIPIFLLAIAGVFFCPGCGKIKGAQFPYIASPRVVVYTPASPASGNISVVYQLIDRELEQGSVVLEYSTDGGQTYNTATLTVPGEATNLASAWHPGETHTVTWDSVIDMGGRSGAVSVCVKITPSDASNPSGTAGVSGTFTVNNIAYNEAPTATLATPAGVQSGNVQINYFLADVESDTCTISVLYSTNDGTSWQAATMGTAGNGLTGLSSSPAGTAHMYLWDSRADNVASSGQVDTIRVRITPADFNAGTAGDTSSFSVDNSTPNIPPTVTITSGPADSSTVATTQVTFTWSGSDTDGSVIGYYYSFDQNPPDIWTTDTSITSPPLSEGQHTFRVVAMDDENDLSAVATRTFTVLIPGTITAQFSATPLTGSTPLTVNFTDLSTATNGITSWSWDFGDTGTSTLQNPQHVYLGEGIFTVSLTVTGPDGNDTETKTSYITVTSPGGDTIYVDGAGGDDTKSGLDWPNAVKTIQTGLDKASNGWTVLVKSGTYAGNLCFHGKEIHLKSTGGSTACIIDCGNDGLGFYFDDDETDATIVDGFTIQNGNPATGQGGAVHCSTASPKITNCIIQNNSAQFAGGAFYIYWHSYPTISNCAIIGNTSDSGGGAIWCSFSDPVITNCLIADNSADYGAGIYLVDSNPVITNCTIARNSAAEDGGGMWCGGDSNPSLQNTIVWGNDAANNGNQLVVHPNGDMTISYSDFADNTMDPDNIYNTGSILVLNGCFTLNPLFVNATAQNYRLDTGSPCIDAGDNSHIPPGVTTDLDGNIRITNGTVDIGAYEFRALPQYAWTHTITATTNSYLVSCCADTSGNIYVAGSFEGNANFAGDWGGSDTKTSAGKTDIFITKIDSSGNYCWTRRMGGTNWDSPETICTDAANNVYVAGYFWGTTDFGQDWGSIDIKTFSGNKDVFLTKLDASGGYCWTRRIGGTDIDITYDICTDSNGNVYVSGAFGWLASDYNVDFAEDWGMIDVKVSAGSNDIFVTKVGTDGGYCWTHRMGGPESEYANGICADGGSNIYITASIKDTDPVNFAQDWGGTDEVASAGDIDAVIIKIDTNGNYGWTHRIGGSFRDRPCAISTDSSGNIFVSGNFEDTVNFGEDWSVTDIKTAAGSGDIFIAKLDAGGNYCWAHRLGGASGDSVVFSCIGAGNRIFLAGGFQGSVNFAEDWGAVDMKICPGFRGDAYITALTTGGEYGWTYRIGSTESESGHAVCSDTQGNVYLAGRFKETVNFAEDWGGVDLKTSFSEQDIFITKIVP